MAIQGPWDLWFYAGSGPKANDAEARAILLEEFGGANHAFPLQCIRALTGED